MSRQKTAFEIALQFDAAIRAHSSFTGPSVANDTRGGRAETLEWHYRHPFSLPPIEKSITTLFSEMPIEDRALVTIRNGQIQVGDYCLHEGAAPLPRAHYASFLFDAIPTALRSDRQTFADLEAVERAWSTFVYFPPERSYEFVSAEEMAFEHTVFQGADVTFIKLPPVRSQSEFAAAAIVFRPLLRGEPPRDMYSLYALEISEVHDELVGTVLQEFQGCLERDGVSFVRSVLCDLGRAYGAFGLPEISFEKFKLAVLVEIAVGVKYPRVAWAPQLCEVLGNGPRVFGLEKEVCQLASSLEMRSSSWTTIVGAPGVGKTTLVELYAQRHRQKRVLMLTSTDLIHAFEEPNTTIERIFGEASALGDTVIFLREAFHFLTNRIAYQVLRRRGGCSNVPLIIELTAAQQDELRARFPEVIDLTQEIRVDEPSQGLAATIVSDALSRYEQQHQLHLSPECAATAVALSLRWHQDAKLPGKAFHLLERSISHFKIARASGEATGNGVTSDWIERTAREMYQIRSSINPILRDLSFEGLVANIGKRVFAQDHAVRKFAEAVQRARAGLKPSRRPVGAFLLAGSTGVGKTELAKALAEAVYGDEQALLRYDMSECYDEHVVAKFIGSPVGYTGSDEGGDLTNKMIENPYRVVLFDEFEKADWKIQDLFLQVLDEACLTDARGRRASFSDAIIIFTTNSGTDSASSPDRVLGFQMETDGSSRNEEYCNTIAKAVRAWLRPEFLARLEAIVLNPLSRSTARRILGKLEEQLRSWLLPRGFSISIDDAVAELVLDEGFSPKEGARKLEQSWNRRIIDPLSTELAAAVYPPGSEFIVSLVGGLVSIRVFQKKDGGADLLRVNG